LRGDLNWGGDIRPFGSQIAAGQVTAVSLDARDGLPGFCERRLVRAPGQHQRLTHGPRPVLNQRLGVIAVARRQLWLDGWKGIVMRYLAGGVRRLIGIGLAGTAMVAAASLMPGRLRPSEAPHARRDC
jgi:hypothetical protein